MGLKGKPPTFISNFLFEREFKVRIISTYYDMHAQEMVVLQGSILKPKKIDTACSFLAKAFRINA
jgi:hypothetical protein